MTRVALTGIGFMGKTHLGVYHRLPNIEVVAVCDVQQDRTEITSLDAGGNIAAATGSVDISSARRYTDFAKMLAEGGFDLVDICLPTSLHAEYSIEALRKGYHVFCEKPMALTGEEADRVIDEVERSGLLFSVGQCLRFWPAYVEAKKIIDSGRYGAVRYAEYARFSATPTWAADNWLADAKRSGSAALDLHIHDVDMILYIHGRPESVRSSGIIERDGSIPHISTLYRYDGPVVTSTGGWLCSDSFGFNMRAMWVLEGATVELDFSKEHQLTLCPKGGKREAVALPEGDGYYHELADFCDAAATGRRPGIVTARSAAETVKLCLLEMRSARESRELPVKL